MNRTMNFDELYDIPDGRERAPDYGCYVILYSGKNVNLRFSSVALAYLEADAAVLGVDPVRVALRVNGAGDKVAFAVRPGGLTLFPDRRIAGSKFHRWLGRPAGVIRIELAWDEQARMLVGDVRRPLGGHDASAGSVSTGGDPTHASRGASPPQAGTTPDLSSVPQESKNGA